MNKLIVILSILIGGLFIPNAPANAEDHRPCVSTTEYHETTDVVRLSLRGEAATPTRKELERRWEVVQLGVIDPEYTDARSTFWMYPVCGYNFSREEAQVWLVENNNNHHVMVISLWKAPGATSNGHEY